MRNLRVVAMGVVLLVLNCGPARASFIDDQVKPQVLSKWTQWVDVLNGRDVTSFLRVDPEDVEGDVPLAIVAADDWRCTNGLPVTDFHWWGSYLAGEPGGGVWGFGIFIHADVPATETIPSHPDPNNVLWDAGPLYVGSDVSEAFYASAPDHDIYQYNYVIPNPEEWFPQEEGQVYWLVIFALVNDDVTRWGWHTAAYPVPENGIDAAVTIRNYDLNNDGAYSQWGALFHNEERVQMAFELSTTEIPEPTALCLVGTAALTTVGVFRRRRIR